MNGLLSVEGGFFAGIKNKLVNSDDFSEGVNVEVNVNISDIKTKEEFEQEQITLQDRMSDVGEAVSSRTSRAKDSIQDGAKNTRDQVNESRANSRVE